MNSKTRVALGLIPCILLVLFGLATSDLDQDKQRCSNTLVGLATCLPYVSDESKSPPIDCCTGLKMVVSKMPECLCILIKDRDDPSLGLKLNATRALSLPDTCKIPGTSIANCPALLHLAPNSPDAKIFEDFANSAGKVGGSSSASAPSPSAMPSRVRPAATGGFANANSTSDGEKIRKKFLWMQMLSGPVFTLVVAFHSF